MARFEFRRLDECAIEPDRRQIPEFRRDKLDRVEFLELINGVAIASCRHRVRIQDATTRSKDENCVMARIENRPILGI